MFVRSFQDSDGDGVGDLRGLTSRLDELNDGDPATTDDLGVTGIWLMPVAEALSYHGYDVTDYSAVEADYGTAEDFRAFVDAAHERGIAVIVDFVINHTSRDHPWFQDSMTPGSEHADWYLWSDDAAARRPLRRQPRLARSRRPLLLRLLLGGHARPQPREPGRDPRDRRRRERLDRGTRRRRLSGSTRRSTSSRTATSSRTPRRPTSGCRRSATTSTPAIPRRCCSARSSTRRSISSGYVQDGSLDLTFDFGFGQSAIISLNSRDGGSFNAALDEIAEAYPRDTLATFLTNHDQNRLIDQLGGDPAAARLAAALLLTGPGVPFVYYGEEIGMSGRKPDERIRTPMRWDATEPAAGFSTVEPWEPLSVDPAEVNVAGQAADPGSLRSLYRDLIRYRAATPALSRGDLLPVESSDRDVVAYLRATGDDARATLVVANMTDDAVPAPALSLESGPLCGSPTASLPLDPSVQPAAPGRHRRRRVRGLRPAAGARAAGVRGDQPRNAR